MKRSATAAALAVVALGVGKSAAADQAAVAGVSLQPGQWEMVAQIRSIEIPGARPQLQEDVRSQIGRAHTTRNCLTPGQARNPLAQMREAMSQGQTASCRFTEDVFSGGVIRIGATCPGPAPEAGGEVSTSRMSMEGSFTATNFQLVLTTGVEGPSAAAPGATEIRMVTDVRGRRIGECPANPPPPATEEPPPQRP